MPRETAKLKILYRGVAITYAECDKCREPMQYLTDKPYRHCPYCGSAVTEDRTQKKGSDKNETARREDGQDAAERIHPNG